MTDLRFALRSLSRAPGFTLVTILTLALGIGSTTAIFSVVNSVLIRPLPFAAPGELVVARGSLADLRDVSAGTTAFQATAVWGSNLYNLDAGGDTRQVRGAIVSPQMLPVLGVSPLLGRTFTDEDDRSDTVILSYGLWQSSFGGDPAVLGRTIQLTGAPYTVIGVTPPWFRFPSSDYVLWTPLGSAEARTPTQIRNRALRIFSLVGRLAPGVTLQRARADVAAVAARLSHDYPQTNADVSIAVRPLSEYLVGDLRGSLLVVFGAVSLLLLIACANVANLMLARTTLRQRELAIRAALGAGRGRLLRQLTAESLLLAVGGGAVGLLLAMWGVDALPAALDARLPRADGVQLDAAVLFFASGATLLTALLFGVAPAALSVSTAGVSPLLTTREASASPRARRARGAIVVAEIALAMIVIVGAGLMVRTFTALSQRDPGFDPARLMTFHLQLVNQPGDEARIQVLGAVLARLRGIPGIEAAGGSSGFPVVAAQRGTRMAAEGRQLSGNEDSAFFMAATPEYFRALGTSVLQGRAFSDADTAAAPPVIVINRRLAESVFKGVDPIGRRMRLLNPDQRDDWRTVVGVVGNLYYQGAASDVEPAVYTPFAQTPFLWSYVMVRAQPGAGNVLQTVRAAVASAAPGISAANLRPMTDVLSESVAEPRVTMMLTGTFGTLALALAAVGIFGLISYTAASRTREIGVRRALGAGPADIVRLIVGHGLSLALVGVAIGTAAAIAVTTISRSLASVLFEVTPHDPITYLAGAALLCGVAALASWIPALRAMRIAPVTALRQD